jgi:hypothetical protein
MRRSFSPCVISSLLRILASKRSLFFIFVLLGVQSY